MISILRGAVNFFFLFPPVLFHSSISYWRPACHYYHIKECASSDHHTAFGIFLRIKKTVIICLDVFNGCRSGDFVSKGVRVIQLLNATEWLLTQPGGEVVKVRK